MASTPNVLQSVGQELKDNPPKVLARTAAKFGPQRAQKQRVAILLSKARRQGAKIPSVKGQSY